MSIMNIFVCIYEQYIDDCAYILVGYVNICNITHHAEIQVCAMIKCLCSFFTDKKSRQKISFSLTFWRPPIDRKIFIVCLTFF